MYLKVFLTMGINLLCKHSSFTYLCIVKFNCVRDSVISLLFYSIKFSVSTVYASFVMHVDCTTATQPLNKANYDLDIPSNKIT